MRVTLKLESGFDDLIRRHSGFAQIKGVSIESSPERFWKRPHGRSSHDLLVAVIGKSGYGKSSLINELIGCSVMDTSATVACTRDVQCADFRIDEGHYLSFVDLPGIGESAERDREYLEMYRQIILKADLIVYLLRADSRDLAIDEAAWEALFPDQAYRDKVLLALNCCDKVEPISRVWNSGPSAEQLLGVDRRIELIREACPWIREVVPCCANPGWNMDKLVGTIVDRLLNSEGVTPSLEEQIRQMAAGHSELAQVLSSISRMHAQFFG